MKFFKHFLEAQKAGVGLDEIYASIPGSLENYTTLVRKALKGSSDFGTIEDDWGLDIEGLIGSQPTKVVIHNYKENLYYQADVSFINEEGSDEKVRFSNIKEVEMEVAIKAKNEFRKNEAINLALELKDFTESIDASLDLNEKEASVTIAQEAETINANGRVYPKDVLEDAVEAAKERIEEYGPLLMDSQHRNAANGNSVSDLREIVALIHEIEFNESVGTVSLPRITFVDNQAGNDVVKLLDAGAKLQVSQRAHGTSSMKKMDGEDVEEVKFLRFKGFDLVPGGEASVKSADFNLHEQEKSEEEPEDAKSGEEPESQTKTEEIVESTKEPEADPDPIEESKEEAKEELEKSESQEEEVTTEVENSNSQEKPEGGNESMLTEQQIKEMVEKAVENGGNISVEELTNLSNQLTEQNTQVASLLKDRNLNVLKAVGDPIIKAKVDELERYNESQKQLVINSIDLKTVYDSISDVNDIEEITSKLTPLIDAEIDKLDKALATARVEFSGFSSDGTEDVVNANEGFTNLPLNAMNEHIPGAELREKIQTDVQAHFNELGEADEWRMPDDHIGQETLKKMMEGFYMANHGDLLNEANEVGQGQIGVRAATISSIVIPIAWRATTAFQVVETGRMTRLIEDHPVAFWTPDNINEDAVTAQFMALNVAEGATIPNAGVKYENFPITATRQALKTQIRPHAMAAARGTSMRPVIDSIAGLAMDIRNRVDRMLWYLHVIAGLQQEAVSVSTFETLTNITGTMEWKSVNKGWIPLEWYKSYDANNNPTASQFRELHPASGEDDLTGTTLQPVEVTTTNATPVDLLYGTDYTVNWTDGSITLTAAGETKRASDNIRVKYSYSKNINFWSVNPPAGTTVYNHLINLRRAVGIAKVRVGHRNYMPNFLGMNLDIEDLIGNSPHMTTLGGTPADMLTRVNEVSRYAGLAPVNTTALDPNYIIVAMRNSVTHKVQTPWNIRGPIVNEDTGDDNYIAQQFSGTEAFVNNKIGIVGITGRHNIS